MTTMTPDRAHEIVHAGRVEILDDYAQRDFILGRLHDAFHAAVEALAGAAARKGVERDGLRQLHRHLPANQTGRLEDIVRRTLRDDLYYWAYKVGRDTLALAGTFYIDMLIVMRVHYPHLVAREGGAAAAIPFDWAERTRLGLAGLRNPAILANQLARRIRKRGKIAEHRIAYDAKAYHGDLPTLARSHGPHIDTWYGHSFDGFNVWLSIDGVNPDNSVILYPEMFGRQVDYDPRSMYLARGIPLPAPTKVDLKPGQLLLFNPEMLHGTQVNISDDTRVALTMRINPQVPRFNDDAPFNAEHWYASDDVAARRFTRISLFAANKFSGAPSVAQLPADRSPDVVAVADGAGAVLCASADLAVGGRIGVDAGTRKLLLVRTADGVRAYDRRCPHQGIDLIDGHVSAGEIFCPGHGVAFDLADGRSKCAAFTLRRVAVDERDGQIVLVGAPVQSRVLAE